MRGDIGFTTSNTKSWHASLVFASYLPPLVMLLNTTRMPRNGIRSKPANWACRLRHTDVRGPVGASGAAGFPERGRSGAAATGEVARRSACSNRRGLHRRLRSPCWLRPISVRRRAVAAVFHGSAAGRPVLDWSTADAAAPHQSCAVRGRERRGGNFARCDSAMHARDGTERSAGSIGERRLIGGLSTGRRFAHSEPMHRRAPPHGRERRGGIYAGRGGSGAPRPQARWSGRDTSSIGARRRGSEDYATDSDSNR